MPGRSRWPLSDCVRPMWPLENASTSPSMPRTPLAVVQDQFGAPAGADPLRAQPHQPGPARPRQPRGSPASLAEEEPGARPGPPPRAGAGGSSRWP